MGENNQNGWFILFYVVNFTWRARFLEQFLKYPTQFCSASYSKFSDKFSNGGGLLSKMLPFCFVITDVE